MHSFFEMSFQANWSSFSSEAILQSRSSMCRPMLNPLSSRLHIQTECHIGPMKYIYKEQQSWTGWRDERCWFRSTANDFFQTQESLVPATLEVQGDLSFYLNYLNCCPWLPNLDLRVCRMYFSLFYKDGDTLLKI